MGFPVLILRAMLVLACLVSTAAASPPPPFAGKARCLACHRLHAPTEGDCVSCHRGNPATERKALAHAGFLPAAYARFTRAGAPEVRRGRELLDRSGCRRCHLSGGEGSRLAADLDAAFEARPVRLHDAIRSPAVYMPDFRFDEASVRELVNAIYANGREHPRAGGPGPEIPAKVHFAARPAGPDAPPFPKYCGPCHRALSGTGSGMGGGAVGPNLSALFTPFYPGRPAAGIRWTPEALGRWVANPRTLRPGALMPPLRIPAREFGPLIESLRISPDPRGIIGR